VSKGTTAAAATATATATATTSSLQKSGYRHFSCHTLLDCRHTAAIQQRVTAVLLSIPKEALADSFHKLYERCQPVL
jgi:hypothetical protein